MKHALLAFAGFILFCFSIYLGMHVEFLAAIVALFLGLFAIVRGGSKLLDGGEQ
jgi:uncharacterized membrane protein